MRKAVPIALGIVLLLVGLGWASQGAGMVGGSSLMDHNETFVYLGGIVAILGIALVAFGTISKPGPKQTTAI